MLAMPWEITQLYEWEITALTINCFWWLIEPHDTKFVGEMLILVIGFQCPVKAVNNYIGRADVFGKDSHMESAEMRIAFQKTFDRKFKFAIPSLVRQYISHVWWWKTSKLLQIRKTVADCDLVEQIDTRAEKLSGGQKRKLNVGMALIGNPKVLFHLDVALIRLFCW